MKAKIYITYKDGILDPQGTTVNKALKSMNIKGIKTMQIGKYIEMDFSNKDKKKAIKVCEEACTKLLANHNTESYKYEIVED